MYKSTFLGLNTALRGVLAHQHALDVTGHNIANLNTEGYSRQRAEAVTAPPWSSPAMNSQTTPGQLGTGVEVLRIERLRDRYVDQNLRTQFGYQGNMQATVEQLQQVESAFQEPSDRGISALMQKFYSAMDDVAAHPDDISARQSFANAADALAAGFRKLDTDLNAIATQSDTRLNDTVTEINTISQRIAAHNTDIADALVHQQQPNDLLDERDRLMDDLSKLVNFTYTEAPTGEVTITFGSTIPINLVDPLAVGGFTNIVRADLDTAFLNGDLTSGRAFADEQLFNVTIPAYIQQLDDLVNDLVTDINAQNAAGFDLNGAAGGNIFDAAGLTAGTMRLDAVNNILTNPRLIAAASSWLGTGEPGNGANFEAMVNLRYVAQGAPLNATWEGFYQSVVTGLGSASQTAQKSLENADVLVEMATARRDQVSGVSLDEEMSNMLRFQHAYNASARVMTTIDDALDTIINRMGRVGL